MKKLVLLVLTFYVGVYASAQITVSGTITSSDDQSGLPGVSVTVKGSSTGTVADSDGNFSIACDNKAILVFTYIGYQPKEVSVNGQTYLQVVLDEDSKYLEEVVVVGYGTLEKKNVTSSITSITAKELPKGVGGASIANAMKGKINSLSINETPSPNSGLTLQLRGMASVNASAAPLVVIDGMPGGDIKSVAEEDIQSIDVLKDAAAGSIYGTRATGGVILITTKQAREGKLKLSYTGEMMLKKSFGKPRIMNAQEYLKYRPNAVNYGSDIDWWAEGMSDDPTSYRHELTIQGGAKDARIYASFIYNNNKGVLAYDTRKDLGGRINGNFKLLDGWLDLKPRVSYRQAKRNQSNPSLGVSGTHSYPPTQPGIGTLLSVNPTRNPYNPTQWDTKNGLDDPNTIIDASLITNQGLEKWFQPGVEAILNVKPISGLSYHQTASYENHQYEWQYYAPSTVTLTETQNRSGQGTAVIDFQKTDIMNVDGYLSYIKQINDNNYINAVAGYSYFEQNGEWFGMKNLGFAVDGVKMWNIGSGMNLNNPKVTDGNLQAGMNSYKAITNRLLAFFGRANYSFMDRYLVSGTFRREASSKFAANKRWGNFGQASAAWRISKEDFWQDLSGVVNDLKVRASYGVTGSEGFSGTYAATMYSSGGYWILPDGQWAYGYGIIQNINPDLGWEEKHEWNFGVDFESLNGRIFGKVDIYNRQQKGLLYEINVPSPPYVYDKMMSNIGTMKNAGWELELGGKVVDTRNWSYSTKLNLSHNTTTMGEMNGSGDETYINGSYIGRAGYVHRLQEGVDVGSFFLYKHAGFTKNYSVEDAEGNITTYPDGLFMAYRKDGSIVVPEIDGKLDEDKQYMGNYLPKIVAGWTHNLTYKNWELSATLTSWIGFDIYDEIEHTMGTQGGLPGALRNQLLVAFTDNAHIKGQTLETDYFLKDGTFLKIQNLSLAYKLNTKKWTGNLVESARLYFTGNNLYTFTGYNGLNPEVDITGWGGGIESVVYPQTRTFAFGIQLTF
jgi:TonB-linked SusC/RagA family outer membrane protein